MKWFSKQLTFDEQYPEEKPWHWYFAWRPIEYQGTVYWGCWIPRRFVRWSTSFGLFGAGPCYAPEYCHPEHSICGNVLGPVAGRRHGPNARKL